MADAARFAVGGLAAIQLLVLCAVGLPVAWFYNKVAIENTEPACAVVHPAIDLSPVSWLALQALSTWYVAGFLAVTTALAFCSSLAGVVLLALYSILKKILNVAEIAVVCLFLFDNFPEACKYTLVWKLLVVVVILNLVSLLWPTGTKTEVKAK